MLLDIIICISIYHGRYHTHIELVVEPANATRRHLVISTILFFLLASLLFSFCLCMLSVEDVSGALDTFASMLSLVHRKDSISERNENQI